MTTEEYQIDKVHNKIPSWFKVNKQHQMNSRILLRFLKLQANNTYVSFEDLKEQCVVDMPLDKFKSNYSQMTNFEEKNNGKIFDDTDGHPSPTPKSNRHFKYKEKRQYSPLGKKEI